MPGPRRKARIAALQALYETSCTKHEAEGTISRLIEEMGLEEDAPDFARKLVAGVTDNKARIDGLIKEFAPAWPIEQLSLIDLNILRLAIFEFFIDDKLSASIAINEAVELAKSFGSESSPKFINGVLGAISKNRPDSTPLPPKEEPKGGRKKKISGPSPESTI